MTDSLVELRYLSVQIKNNFLSERIVKDVHFGNVKIKSKKESNF